MSKPVPYQACGKNHPTKVVFFASIYSAATTWQLARPRNRGLPEEAASAWRPPRASVLL